MEVPSSGSWDYGLDEQLSDWNYRYHPLVYKTKACVYFRRDGKCKNRENCAFRHIDRRGVDNDKYYCKEYMPWYPGMRKEWTGTKD